MNKKCRTINQNGRSMIKMLGVLAIIGVLSVGGIAGYPKAMMKFKINKTIDQITQISQNVRMLYGRQMLKYHNLDSRTLYKDNLAPKEMFDSGYMTNAWGEVFNMIGVGAYFGLATMIPSEEACIELATQDWESRDTTGLNSVIIVSSALPNDDSIWGNCSGEKGNGYAVACSGGANISLPMPVDIAVEACSSENLIYWFFQ